VAPPTSNQYLTELPGELDDAQRAAVREPVSSKSAALDAFGHMSDEWVAARVRMLMRTDPWFEPICSAGRDRIIRLVLKYEALLVRFEKACARITELESAAETTGEWRSIDTRPKDLDSTYLVTNGRQVAPWIRGVIHNNTGTPWDWDYGSNIIGWMPLPSPLKTSPERSG
jgi:hypothetical protein